MDDRNQRSCRGCLQELQGADAFSFSWPEIRELFRDCTSLPISPEEHDLPQQICLECYNKCEQWYSFKEMCHDVDRDLRKGNAPPIMIKQEPPDSDEELEEDFSEYNFGQLETTHPVVLLERLEMPDIEADPPESEVNTTQVEEQHWKCPVCNLMFPPAILLRDHFREHFSEENPQCPVCDQKFSRSSKVYPHFLSRHLDEQKKRPNSEPRTKNTNKRIKLEPLETNPPSIDCTYEEDTNEDVGDYTETLTEWINDEQEPQNCPICKKTVISAAVHLINVHSVNRNKCPLCDHVPGNSAASLMIQHLYSHTGETWYNCALCSSKMKSKSSLRKHLKIQHSTSKQFSSHEKLHCLPCKMQFQCRLAYEIHMKCHIEDTPPLSRPSHEYHSLELEPIKVTNLDDYTETMSKWINEDQEPDDCQICKKQVVSLSHHIFLEHTSDPKVCSLCGEGQRTYSAHIRHLMSHTNEKWFRCIHCPAIFCEHCNLIRHIRTNHPGQENVERPDVETERICGFCDRTYKNPLVFEIHLRSHKEIGGTQITASTDDYPLDQWINEQPPQKCQKCQKTVSSLALHTFLEHVTDKQCPHCDITPKRKSELMDHLASHTRESWFKCAICRISFTSNHLLMKHLNTVHRDVQNNLGAGVDPLSCEVCNMKFTVPLRFEVHKMGHEVLEEETEEEHRSREALAKWINVDQEPMECRICQKKVNSLALHNLLKHATDESKCFECGQAVKGPNKYLDHFYSHTNEKWWRCALCSQTFRFVYNLSKHIEQYHPDFIGVTKASEKLLPCSMCHLSFQSELKLELHRRCHDVGDKKKMEPSVVHHEPVETQPERKDNLVVKKEKKKTNREVAIEKYSETMTEWINVDQPAGKCQICKKTVTSVALHTVLEHTEDVNKCALCDSTPGRFSATVYHLYSHSNESWYKCSFCSVTYRTPYSLIAHLASIHPEKGIDLNANNGFFTCPFCDLKFNIRLTFEVHMRGHGQVGKDGRTPETPFSCATCKKGFDSEQVLMVHQSNHRDTVRGFLCMFCDSTYSQNYNMERHLLAAHPDESREWFKKLREPVQCPQCPKQYSTLFKLKQHLHAHGSLFWCRYCKMRFKETKNLKEHLKRMGHLVEHSRRLEKKGSVDNICHCPYCKKQFWNSRVLTKHVLRQHEKHKLKMTCTTCGKKFKDRHGLSQHIESHREMKHQCAHCEKSFRHKTSLDDHVLKMH